MTNKTKQITRKNLLVLPILALVASMAIPAAFGVSVSGNAAEYFILDTKKMRLGCADMDNPSLLTVTTSAGEVVLTTEKIPIKRVKLPSEDYTVTCENDITSFTYVVHVANTFIDPAVSIYIGNDTNKGTALYMGCVEYHPNALAYDYYLIIPEINQKGWSTDGGSIHIDIPEDVPDEITVECHKITHLESKNGKFKADSHLIAKELIPLEDYVTGDYSNTPTTSEKKKNGGGCSGDCTPPTLGVNAYGKRMVDNGFTYNGQTVDVELYHTEFPLITATVGETNTVDVKIYENSGTNSVKWVQMALGIPEIGSPLNDAEVLVQLVLTNTQIDDIIVTDKQNLIDEVHATAQEQQCQTDSITQKCMQIHFEYSYREAPLNNVLAMNVMDFNRNGWTHYFNDGVEVSGESINESPTDRQFIKTTSQDKGIWLELERTDKVNNIWSDQFGIKYHKENNHYDRITPMPEYECNDAPLDQIMNGGDRNNCHWRTQLSHMWSY